MRTLWVHYQDRGAIGGRLMGNFQWPPTSTFITVEAEDLTHTPANHHHRVSLSLSFSLSPLLLTHMYLLSSHTFSLPLAEGRQAYGSHGSSASSSASSSNHHSSSSHNRHHSDNSNSNNRTNGPFPSFPMGRMRHSSSISSSSEFTSVSQQQPARHSAGSDKEPDRVSIRSGRVGNLGVAANLAQSRESFQQALDNPCEYFIDVM